MFFKRLYFAFMAFFLVNQSVFAALSSGPDSSQILGGDEGDACTMLLCLSDPIGQDLAECQDALKKLASMRSEDRPGFLQKCPIVKGGGGDD